MFDEKYQALSHGDQEDFAVAVNHLLVHSFVVRDIFDQKEKIIKINSYYRFIERNFDLVDEYLSYLGYSILKDVILGVIVLSNTDVSNRVKIDREASLVLYVLRLCYENLKEEASSTSQGVYITTPGLIKTMINYNISFPNKKLTGRLLAKSLRFLANYNIIDKVSGSFDDGDVSFYILPSIVYAIDNNKLEAMSDMLDKISDQNKETDLSSLKGDF